MVKSTRTFGLTGDIQAITSRGEHSHTEIELNILVGQPLRYLFAGRAVTLPTHRWIAYWAALPHGVLETEGANEMVWITVPVNTFLGWDEGGRLARRLLHGEIVVEPTVQPGSTERGRMWARSLQGSDPEVRTITILEVEAQMRRLALTGESLSAGLEAAGADAPGKRRVVGLEGQEAVEVMATWLAEHYRDEVDVAACAAAARLHPNYAMTLFRRTCGTTIWQYLTRLRLAHAQRLLLTTHRDVLAIALDAGFGSQARFYAAFKRAFRTSPGAFRRQGSGT